MYRIRIQKKNGTPLGDWLLKYVEGRYHVSTWVVGKGRVDSRSFPTAQEAVNDLAMRLDAKIRSFKAAYLEGVKNVKASDVRPGFRSDYLQKKITQFHNHYHTIAPKFIAEARNYLNELPKHGFPLPSIPVFADLP